MTDPSISPAAVTPSKRAARKAQRRSLLARMVLQLMGSTGARLGLIWVGMLVFLAVFAPFVANSHPIYWVVDGQGSSPLLKHLTRADVVLLVMCPILIGLLILRNMSGLIRSLLLVGALVVTTTLSVSLISPPETVVYGQYRQAISEGRVDIAYFAPIAYSPADFQRDVLNAGGRPDRQPPSWEHPMGTTNGGADVASRLIHACRVALAIGLLATGIAVTIGIVVGGFMGYFSGWVDLLGMRLVEIFSAMPVIFLLIMICAFYDRNIYLMMTVIGLTGWVGYALFIRAEFLKLRKMDYVQAARAVGASLPAILFKHMLPNGVTPILVLASFGIASAILLESTLSFLGLGLPPQDPSWGQLLNEARNLGPGAWWLMIFPGLMIFLTVFAYNLIGEALRDVIDPRAAK